MPDDAMVPAGSQKAVASKSVQGYSHLASGKVCQDSSLACVGEEEAWHVAIVSDGHGDSSCVRSDRGSRLAVEVAAQSLGEFARAAGKPDAADHSLQDDLRLHARQDTVVRRLTDAILARWRAAVHADLQEQPFTEEELAGVSDRYRERYAKGERLEHAYGATLLCALWLPKALLLIQQGDGLCLVVDANGEVSEPVPEDERCLMNITTSLCDDDAADAIRHAVINLREQPVAAVVLGSDGVANSFASNDVTSYARGLLMNLAEDGDASRLEGELGQSLPELSHLGSGDDMSVALIADLDAIRELGDVLQMGIERQNLESQLGALQAKLASMERKHTILGQRRDDALAEKARLEEELRAGVARLGSARAALEEGEWRLDECAAQRDKLGAVVESKRAELADRPPSRPVIQIGSFEVRLIDRASRSLAKLERKLAEAMVAYDDACERYEGLLDAAQSIASDVERTQDALDSFDDTPVREFEEYDAQYVHLQVELVKCQSDLAALDNGSEE